MERNEKGEIMTQDNQDPQYTPQQEISFFALMIAPLWFFIYLCYTISVFFIDLPFYSHSVRLVGNASHVIAGDLFYRQRTRIRDPGWGHDVTTCANYAVKGKTYKHCEVYFVEQNELDTWKFSYAKGQPVELIVNTKKPWKAKFFFFEAHHSLIFVVLIFGFLTSITLLCGAAFQKGEKLKILFGCVIGNQLILFGLSVCFMMLVPNSKYAFAVLVIGIAMGLSCIPLWMFQKKLLLKSNSIPEIQNSAQ